jgi:hypothetical protein
MIEWVGESEQCRFYSWAESHTEEMRSEFATFEVPADVKIQVEVCSL